MDGGDGREDLAPRLAAVFPVAFLGLTLLTRFGNAVYWSGPAGGAVLAALFVLPLLYAIPPARTAWTRSRGRLLALQAFLTYAPLVVFGQHWVNAGSGLLAGLLLLTLRPPRSWLLFAAVLAAEAVRIAVLGIPWQGPDGEFVTWMLVAPVTTGLAFFGLVRLTDMVAALHGARTDLADLAVTRERRRSAERLRAAIGDNLEVVAAHAGAALAALSERADEARAELTAASAVARRALDRVRTAVAAERLDARHGHVDGGLGQERTGARVAPRLARLTLAVVLAGQVAILMANILVAGGAGVAIAGATVTIAVLGALQLRHSLGRRAAARPRAWRLTLAAQTVLPFAWLPAYDWNVLTLAGFAAGSALLFLPRRWAWPAFASVVAGVGVAWSLPVLGVYYGVGNRVVHTVADENITVLYQMGAVATAGIVVYGLSRLTDLAEQVEATRRELAREAVERERSRVAQDTHDLLGLGLSAVALKSDLAGRLIGRDEARARGELETLRRLTGQALAELRAVSAGEHAVSLRTELDAARDVLASAGVAVDVRTDPRGEPLPADVDAMLAIVLREAVTNVLRHSTAVRCELELTAGNGEARLRVVNDGVPDDAVRRSEGRGLANLAARAAASGGRLSSRSGNGRYELSVRAPLPAAASAPCGKDPLAAGDPAHGVDEDLREAVLDEEA